ncbi:GNAT family N-acetyltransferase [bacterium]|nr:GNAT family N-acetyltransferase [bacterium]
MNIRLMTQQDIPFAVKMAVREKWLSENEDVFRAFLLRDANGCFVAEQKAVPVGICVATAYRESGFFGELIVSHEHRGHGIGAKLLDTALAYLKGRSVKTIYLDAVPAAIPLYERAGFRKVCTSYRFEGKIDGRESEHVRAMRKWDLDDVCDLDRKYFGEDRQFYLKWISFIGPDFAKVLTRDDAIVGYITGRYTKRGIQVGPWIQSPGMGPEEDLLLSLAAEILDESLHLGVLETNTKTIRLLRSLGFRERETLPVRMALGERSDLGTSHACFAIGSPAKG